MGEVRAALSTNGASSQDVYASCLWKAQRPSDSNHLKTVNARDRLDPWRYTKSEAKRDLTLLELTNPHLRQLDVPGRLNSLAEAELIHLEASQYLFQMARSLDGVVWRPRLGAQGATYVFSGEERKAGT